MLGCERFVDIRLPGTAAYKNNEIRIFTEATSYDVHPVKGADGLVRTRVMPWSLAVVRRSWLRAVQ